MYVIMVYEYIYNKCMNVAKYICMNVRFYLLIYVCIYAYVHV
jgi:hypothetical protein